MKTLIITALALTSFAATAATAKEPVNFPAPAHSWLSEGLYVTLATARLIKPGMTKPQVRALLGPPHFGEGYFSTRWNYVLNFYTNNGAGPDHVTCQLRLDYTGGIVASGLWNFQTCADLVANTPPVTVVAVAAPAPAPAITIIRPGPDVVLSEMTVLFDNNSSALTPAARRVIAAAVAMTKSQPVRKTVVIGSTDRTGSIAHNLQLSSDRANAVATALTNAGVVLADATVAQTGEESPAVPTANGVGNAANRRVVITLIQ